MKVEVEPLWLRVKGVSPAPRAATSERVEVQRFDVLVVLTMELLNSIGHKDYLCDHTVWGAELCRRIGSPNFKLLYDIYHMQIMEGNVIEHIRKYHQYFSHIHTGGVPGRAEIDETQELYYPAIMKAIVETGYKGFVGQEFVPKQEDKIASLEKCIRICDV